MKRFRCIPVAIVLPIFFLAGAMLFAALLVWAIFDKDAKTIIPEDMGLFIGFCGFMIIMGMVYTVALLPGSNYSVTIHPDYIECKSLSPKSRFFIRYDECSIGGIGMDFHIQSGIKVWWIYLCKDPLATYKKGKQINSVKIRPGFVRIMYSDEVYRALVEVLPKKHQTALITAHRYAGMDEE